MDNTFIYIPNDDKLNDNLEKVIYFKLGFPPNNYFIEFLKIIWSSIHDILRDKTIVNILIYIPNVDKQNYTF